jgi:glycosyltransferase involved in cell wall biosynthesis
MNTSAASKPLITFVIIAYNQQEFIRDAIEGAFSQTYSPLEVILSDDYSTDKTYDIMQNLVENYSGQHQVVLNRNVKNMGIGSHVSIVMRIAKGEFIVVAAGDDISMPKRVEFLYESLVGKSNNNMICSANYFIDENGVKVNGISKLFSNPENDIGKWVEKLGPIHRGATYMLNRRLFNIFGPLRSTVVNEDIVITFRALLLGGWQFVPEPLVFYRIHAKNLHKKKQFISDFENLLDTKLIQSKRQLQVYKQLILDLKKAKKEKIVSIDSFNEIRNIIKYSLINTCLDIKFYSYVCGYKTLLIDLDNFKLCIKFLLLSKKIKKTFLHFIRYLFPNVYLYIMKFKCKFYLNIY